MARTLGRRLVSRSAVSRVMLREDTTDELRRCKITKDVHGAMYAYNKMTERKIRPDTRVLEALLSVATVTRNWNAAITAFKVVEKCEDIRFSKAIAASMLKACSQARKLEHGRRVMNLCLSRGLRIDSFIASAWISMLERCDALDEAKEFYDSHQHIRDSGVSNALAGAYGRAGHADLCLNVVEGMDKESRDVFTYCSVIRALGKAGRADEAWQWWEEIKNQGLIPNGHVCNAILASGVNPERANTIMGLMEKNKLPMDRLTVHALIGIYESSGLPEEAVAATRRALLSGAQLDILNYTDLIRITKSLGEEQQQEWVQHLKDAGLKTTEEIENLIN